MKFNVKILFLSISFLVFVWYFSWILLVCMSVTCEYYVPDVIHLLIQVCTHVHMNTNAYYMCGGQRLSLSALWQLAAHQFA